MIHTTGEGSAPVAPGLIDDAQDTNTLSEEQRIEQELEAIRREVEEAIREALS